MPDQRPLKLLFVIDNIEFGGGERVFAQIINGLMHKPYELFLASNPGKELYQAINRRAVRCLPVDFSNRMNVSSLKSLIRMIKQNGIDIVHAQGGRAEFYARAASRIAGSVRYVSTIAMPVEGYDVSGLRRTIYCFLDRFTEKYVDRFIVVSDVLKRQMIEGHGVPAEKVIRIYNGIETLHYDPDRGASDNPRVKADWGFRSEDRVVGAVGRLVWQKGFEYLIRGIPDILKAHSETRFLFVGDGPLRGPLQDLSASLGMSHRIVFSGFQRDIKDILAAMDVFVIPSLREGFPMVTLEAMAMAKPIIATNIDGITEQISDGLDGFLVPPGDSAALTRAISAVLRDPLLGLKMGRRARLTVESKFPVEKMVAETERVYHSLIR
jgi:glycosyltransferase involved in cell wall biosynthesis